MVLSFVDGPARVLLMRRARHPEDPWSGQVSLPGGRRDAGDADTLATAIRETREEVGLDLERAGRLLGGLPPVQAVARGRLLPLHIHPWIFALEAPARLHLGSEAAAVFWLPLGLAARGSLDAQRPWSRNGQKLLLPCWHWQGEEIWGLTWRMLRLLLETLDVV